jgi:hypothetical protein
MTNNRIKSLALQSEAETAVRLLDDWFDPIEAGPRNRVRDLIQVMIESELEAALSRPIEGAGCGCHRLARASMALKRPSPARNPVRS